jgi:ABC-type amino acid transport substrate-binding protein
MHAHRKDTTKGEIGWKYAVDYLDLDKDFARFTVVEHIDIRHMMQLVATGDVDVAIADSLSCAQYISRSNSTLRDAFLNCPLQVENNSLMILKSEPTFRDWLNSGLRTIRLDSAIQAEEKQIFTQYEGTVWRVDIPVHTRSRVMRLTSRSS